MSSPEVRFYFSFRSPYSWLAFERWDSVLGSFPIRRELIPIYPQLDKFPNDPAAVPEKVKYIVQDLLRLTQAYGLSLAPPISLDTDWANVHAAFVAADQEGQGESFARALYRARWCEQKDVGLDDVIFEAAERAGLAGDEIVKGAHDESKRTQVIENMERGREQDGIFGVPTFIFNGQMFWGQDRMEFLAEAVRESLRPER
ncbi:MAG: hypothetical protein E2O54_16805 [Gammaproteobacteria bacterium]|nr:MAG: hypothetical protein E2O54_16805 [Gammaproteobacteria bacterium]